MGNLAQDTQIYSVTELNRAAKSLLENKFPAIWLEGEVSNFACPASGHWYFSLKDSQAQVRCAMFRGFNRLLSFTPEAGTQVLIKAKVSLYEGRGDFQLIISHMEEAGFGALQRAYEALKKKLEQEGLFNPIHKQSVPSLPQCIGIITSATGAAIKDILSTLKRRFPSIPVIIYPTAVQGKEAAPQIINAIMKANQRKDCDVLIVARGGGSIEDLWPFNEEKVARAIYASELPIVSGIGHEVDFTIADFVADKRAATPTAAAELCCPNQYDWVQLINQLQQQLNRRILSQLQLLQQRLEWLKKRLQHPGQRLQDLSQRIDIYEQQLRAAMTYLLNKNRHRIEHLQQQFYRYTPQHQIDHGQNTLNQLQHQLMTLTQHKVTACQHRVANLVSALEAISPLATLSRGYAIVSRQSDAKIITQGSDVAVGDKITAKLAQGELSCYVESITQT